MGRIGHRVIHHAETGSTMDDARALADEGAEAGTVVRADLQTRGRGRLGRTWASPEGGLWFSVILRPGVPPKRWGLWPLFVGLAVADVLRARGVPARVKWPNDVLVEGRKVAGVLLEARFGTPDRAPSVVVGVGVNARVALDALPPELHGVAGSLAGAVDDADALFRDVLDNLEDVRRRFEADEVAGLLNDYRQASSTLGRRVEVDGVAGTAVDVRASDGALAVEDEAGRIVHVTAGGVVETTASGVADDE